MQSNATYERNARPIRNARPPVDFKLRDERRKADTLDGKSWTRNDAKRRVSDMLQ